jgi:hypothetical protein
MPVPEIFFAALQSAGIPEVPGEFSVVPRHQVIPNAVLGEIAKFARVFDQVTAREAWQAAARHEAPAIAQLKRPEVCFFSAWDFHLPPEGGCQLIEFNDNGSGFLFAAIINDVYHRVASLREEKSIVPPAQFSAFDRRIGDLVEQEAKSFFEQCPDDLFLIIDDAESLHRGKFRTELRLLCELFRRNGWRAELGCPAQTHWNGRQLLFDGQPSLIHCQSIYRFFLAVRRFFRIADGLRGRPGVRRSESLHLCHPQRQTVTGMAIAAELG